MGNPERLNVGGNSVQEFGKPYLAVRLNTPKPGSLRMSTLLRFSAEVALHGCLGTPRVEVLLEEPNQDYGVLGAASRLLGTLLTSPLTGVDGSESEVQSIGHTLQPRGIEPVLLELRVLPSVQHGWFEVDGLVDIGSLVPEDGHAARTYCLSVVARIDSLVGCSALAHFAVAPVSARRQAYGGMNQLGGVVETDFLELSGWACRADDPVVNVSATLNGQSCGDVQHSISSPAIAELLPDILEAERGGFSLTIPKQALERVGALLRASVIVEFHSGERLELKSNPISWNGTGLAVHSQIESAVLDAEGRVVVSGWVIPAVQAERPPRLWIESRHRWFELPTGSDAHASASSAQWMFREDLESRFPARIQRLPWGFSLVIAPTDIDHVAGPLVLWAEDAGRWERLGHPTDAGKLESLVEQLLCTEPGVAMTLRNAKGVARKAFGLPSRPSIAPTRKPEARGALARVLLCSHNLRATEGAPKVLFEVASELRSSGACSVLVLAGEDGELRNQYEQIGAEVVILPQFHVAAPSWQSFRQSYAAAFAKAAAFAPEIVYANGTDAFWGILLAHELGLPSLFGIHESKSPYRWQPQLATRFRMHFLHALERATQCVFVSEATQRLFLADLRNIPSVVIPNGVPFAEFRRRAAASNRAEVRAKLGISDAATVVSIIGTTTERKGQDVFLRGVRRLVEQLPDRDYRFLIVGARRLAFLAELTSLARELQLESYVEFVEERPEVSDYFLASDVVCICSREESAPLVSLEALAYGVPLVSTPVFGLQEQLTDRETALLFPSEDHVAFAECLRTVLIDEGLREQLIRNGLTEVNTRFELNECRKRHVAELSRLHSTS